MCSARVVEVQHCKSVTCTQDRVSTLFRISTSAGFALFEIESYTQRSLNSPTLQHLLYVTKSGNVLVTFSGSRHGL